MCHLFVNSVEVQLAQIRAGGAPPQQRAVYKCVQERLRLLQLRLAANDINVYEFAGAVGGILKHV